jgi:hypothetical protein
MCGQQTVIRHGIFSSSASPSLSSIPFGHGSAAATFRRLLASLKSPTVTLPLSHPLWYDFLLKIMKQSAREFIRSTTTLLDHLLSTLTQEERHELLDALAGEVEGRLDTLVESVES